MMTQESIIDGIYDNTIRDKNDMYIFFELLNQIRPVSVLDIGMFMKRIGAISRQAMECSIDDGIYLAGIDYMPEYHYKVLENIYDGIVKADEFINNICAFGNPAPTDYEQNACAGMELNRHYDLVYMLRMEHLMSCGDEELIWQWLSGHASYVVTNCDAAERFRYLSGKGRLVDLKLDNNVYALIII